MKLTTVRFGEIDIDESRIFDFVLPLIGFDMLKKFVILEPNKETLFKWLQSVEDPGLAFPIISGSKLKPMFAQFTQGRKADEPLFLSVFNNRMERTQCYRIINDFCRKAGIDYNIGTHTLRKTFGYHHYRKFKDIVVLQKIFNHYSPQVTLRYIGIDQDIIDNSYNNFIL